MAGNVCLDWEFGLCVDGSVVWFGVIVRFWRGIGAALSRKSK